MKQVNFADRVYLRGEKLAETLGTTVQELLSTLAEDAMASLEAQVLDMRKRQERAEANRESGIAAMNLVFEGLTPEDDIKTDPKKIRALEEELERDRLHNLKVSKKLGHISVVRQKVA